MECMTTSRKCRFKTSFICGLLFWNVVYLDAQIQPGPLVKMPTDVQYFMTPPQHESEPSRGPGDVYFFQAITNFPTPSKHSWLVGVTAGYQGPFLRTRVGIIHQRHALMQWPDPQRGSLPGKDHPRATLEGFYDGGEVVTVASNLALVCLLKVPQRGQKGVIEVFLLSTNENIMVFRYEAPTNTDGKVTFLDLNGDGTNELLLSERAFPPTADSNQKITSWQWNSKEKQFLLDNALSKSALSTRPKQYVNNPEFLISDDIRPAQ